MRNDTFTFNNIGIEKKDYFDMLKVLDSNNIDFNYHVQYIHSKDDLYVIHNLEIDTHYTVMKLVKELVKLNIKKNKT